MQIKLKMVQLKSPVAFNGASSLTLHSKDGTLTLDTVERIIRAKPFKPGTIAKSILVFPENVAFAAEEEEQPVTVSVKK